MPMPVPDAGHYPINARGGDRWQPDAGHGAGMITREIGHSDMGHYPVEADPYFNNVSLLLHWNGRNTSVVASTALSENVQMDRSRFRHNVSTAAGSGTLTTLRRLFENATGFGGTDTQQYNDAAEFRMGTTDFTYEVAIYLRSLPTGGGGFNIAGQHNGTATAGRWHLGTGTAAADVPKLVLYIDDVATITSTNCLMTGIWNFIAYCRFGGVGYLFHNGIIVGVGIDATDYVAAVGFFCPKNSGITPATPITQGPVASGVGIKAEERLTQFIARYPGIGYTPQAARWPDQ